MVFSTTFHNNITTVIPNGTDPKAVTDLLHDHGFIISQSPIVTRYSERERQGNKITYDIWEKIDVLPFGLWKREIQFSSTFEDKDDGTTSWIEAPLGLRSQAIYTVRPVSAPGSPNEVVDGAKTGDWILEEAVETSVSIFFKSLVESQMIAARKKIQESVVEKAGELGGKGITGDVPKNPSGL